MADEKHDQIPIQPKIEYVQPEGGIPSIYSNNVALAPTNFDLRLFFGEMVGASQGTVKVNQKVEIVLTWVEAKILAHFLQEWVSSYEKTNGSLAFPTLPPQPTQTNPFKDQNNVTVSVDVQNERPGTPASIER